MADDTRSAEVAQLVDRLLTLGVHVVTLKRSAANCYAHAAFELERYAKQLRKKSRDCAKAAEKFKAEGNARLREHNAFRAMEIASLAKIAERRAVRLRNKAGGAYDT